MVKKLIILVGLGVVLSTSASASAVKDISNDLPIVQIKKDGTAIKTDTPAVLMGSTTMVPLRVIAESTGLKIKWDQETLTVNMETPTESLSESEKIKADLLRLGNKIQDLNYRTSHVAGYSDQQAIQVIARIKTKWFTDIDSTISAIIKTMNDFKDGNKSSQIEQMRAVFSKQTEAYQQLQQALNNYSIYLDKKDNQYKDYYYMLMDNSFDLNTEQLDILRSETNQ